MRYRKPYPRVPDWQTLVVAPPVFGGRAIYTHPDQMELLDASRECRACGRLRGVDCMCNPMEDPPELAA